MYCIKHSKGIQIFRLNDHSLFWGEGYGALYSRINTMAKKAHIILSPTLVFCDYM
jgi:hypothetical protein